MGIYINEDEDSEHPEIDPKFRDITFCIICGIFNFSHQDARNDCALY
jgi:hypothetical protein